MNNVRLNTQLYHAFGFNIQSDIDLLELPLNNIEENAPQIIVEKSDLSSFWRELSFENKSFVIKKEIILFKIQAVGIFSVQKGREILYSPFADADDDLIRLYLLGTCMGAILMQRRVLPLHGSAVAIDGKAYAIIGDSGAGKSTLASSLINMGYQLISDDVIPVTLNEEKLPLITPAYPQQKLWLESLNEFGMDANGYKQIFNRETKYAVPVKNQFVTQKLQLSGIFELVKTDNTEIIVKPIHKLNSLHTLFKHTYRNFFIAQMGLTEWHFNTTVAMAEKINLYQLSRPTNRFTAHELAEEIINAIKEEEILYG